MNSIAWRDSKIDGRVGVSVPYRQTFNDELKALVSSAKFERGREGGVWFFDEESLPAVQCLLDKYYVKTKWFRVEWDIRHSEGIEIDGCNLFYIQRDYWKWRAGSGFDMKIIECKLVAGGSRSNPRVNGHVVVEIALREGAELRPEPTSLTSIDKQESPPNPLETIPTNTIRRELDGRGEIVFDKEQIKNGLSEAVTQCGFNEMSDDEKAAVRKFFMAFNTAMKVVENE